MLKYFSPFEVSLNLFLYLTYLFENLFSNLSAEILSFSCHFKRFFLSHLLTSKCWIDAMPHSTHDKFFLIACCKKFV